MKDLLESALSDAQGYFSRRIPGDPSLQKRENLRLSRTEPEAIEQ
jgi:hypothetical protein